MVRHTRATTYINSCYDIYQTNKEVYQPCSKFHINHDKASAFQEGCSKDSNHQPAQLPTTTTINHFLDEYQNVFQELDRAPLHYKVKHSIELVCGSSLPKTSVYRRYIIENEEIRREIQDLINKGHIQPSSSPSGSPVILVRKKDGT